MVETNYAEEQACQLVSQSQNGDQQATNQLLDVTKDIRHKTMRHLLRRYHVPLQDGEDLIQEAVFWTLEAIQRYAPQRHRSCSFRTYLNRMLRWRLLEYLRQRVRRSNLPYSVEWIPVVAPEEGAQPADYRAPGPAPAAERRELLQKLEDVLRQLEPQELHLWRLMRRGVPLREIAEQLGISYDKAKRTRRKLRASLYDRLRESFEE